MYDKEKRNNIIELYMNGFSSGDISEQTGVSPRTIQYIIKEYKSKLKTKAIEANIKHRVLVVGDLHTPFEMSNYLDFLKKTYDEYKCDTVVFIGDLVDFHTFSRFTKETDAEGSLNELDKSILHLKKYYEAFPNAYICYGNHDSRIMNRCADNGIDKRFIKSFEEIIESPEGWKFAESWSIDNVLYIHGTEYSSRNILTTLTNFTSSSTVIGHQHTLAGIIYTQGKFNEDLKFAMAVGSGIDNNKYAFRYNKQGKNKAIISCGVVLSDKEAYCISYRKEK